jgi:hypothetical protein
MEDAAFLNALRLWARCAKIENMGTERLLALLRKSVASKAPTIDRLLSAGYMAQLRSEHFAAGGMDPTALHRDRIAEVKVAARRRKASCAAATLYMLEKVADRRRKGQKKSRAEHKVERRKYLVGFKFLPEEEKDVYLELAAGRNSSKRQRLHEDQTTADDDYSNKASVGLFGLSYRFAPIRADVINKVADRVGFTTGMAGIRKDFIGGLHIPDEQQIPSGPVYYKTCCPLAFPGVCRTRDAAFFNKLIDAADCLSKLVLPGGPGEDALSRFCRVRGEWMDGERRLALRWPSTPSTYVSQPKQHLLSKSAGVVTLIPHRFPWSSALYRPIVL